jgi:type II secretory pathway pseudopilin PulG
MNTFIPSSRRRAGRVLGFSLIEVLIAVLILATGLLALAALQSALNRNAADSRARSQVAAFVELAVERARTNAAGASYNKLPPAATWSAPWTAAEEDAAEQRAGVSNLNVTITGTQYDGRSGNFVVYNPASPPSPPLKIGDPQYKELHAVATWNDATGAARRYDLVTIVSPRTTTDSNTPFDSSTGPSNESKLPIVRTDSPERAGVIPIAIGDGADTAATNPRPTISSGAVIRTSYEVLTYHNEDATTVKQQRRVETAVVGCSCTPGNAPTGVFFETAQWPAYWNGERYALYTPTPASDAPGESANSGPTAGVAQDGLCTQCCRDHHDGNVASHVKFDPFRSGGHRHYKLVDGTLQLAGANDPYLEACRMIRVDGFWRTAQDLNSAHFGLLKTTNDARSPLPEQNSDTPVNSAVEYYERFVIDYLKANYEPGQIKQTSDAIYAAKGLNAPALIRINRPTPTDTRYLHTRGLYVDNIEPEAQDKINAAHARCTRANTEECILPLLPFTSINLTEAAFYGIDTPGQMTVDTDGFVVFDTQNPNRGRVNAIATATPSQRPDTVTRIHPSNSGLAVRDRGIDPDDDANVTDAQEFEIQGGLANASSGTFKVALSGLPTVQRSPGIAWTIGTDYGNCQGPSPYTCTTALPASNVSANIIVSAYNVQSDLRQNATITCPNSPGSPTIPNGPLTYSPSGQNTARFCSNYRVSAVTGNGALPGTIDNPGKVGSQATGAGSEATTITFNPLALIQPPATPNTVTLTFALEGTTVAPVASCTYKSNGNLNTVTFSDCP